MKKYIPLLLSLLLGLSCTLRAQSLKVYPDLPRQNVNIDMEFDVVIAGKNTHFAQGSTTLTVNFPDGARQATKIKVMNDTMFVARVKILSTTPVGNYTCTATQRMAPPIVQTGALHVITPPTLPITISAVIFNDRNKNCAAEYGTEIDPRMGRRVVQVLPGPFYGVTEETGQGCVINVPSYGTYAVNRLPAPFCDPLCFKTGLYAVLSPSVQTVQRNFPDTIYSCNTKLRVLAKDLPYDNCYYSSSRAELEISGRGTKEVYTYQYYKSVTSTGDTVESLYPYGGNGHYATVTAAKDTLSFVAYFTGKFKILVVSDIGCRDSATIVVNELQAPISYCAAHIDASVSPHAYNLCATDFTISAYTQGTSCFAMEPGTVRMYAWAPNGYQQISQANFSRSYNLPEAGSPGIAVTGYVAPSYKFVVTAACGAKDSVTVQRIDPTCNVQVTATGAYQNGSGTINVSVIRDGYSCSLPVSARRLENGQMYYLPLTQGPEQFTGLPAGTYEVTAYNTTTCVAKDTVAIQALGFPITFGAAGDDYVRGLVRDASGNLYASLSFRGTISLQGTSLTSASTTRRDMALAKFNDAGALLWVKQVGNGQFDMEPRGVNLDGKGNVYWAGSFAGTVSFPPASSVGGPPPVPQTISAAGSYDAFTARFNPATGACQWVRRVGGAGNDYLYACFVSNSGNVYAGGSYTGTIQFPVGANLATLQNAGGLDGFIVKWDSSGNGIYASRMGSAADDEVKSIEYNGGDLLACGYMGNNTTFPSGTNASPSTTTLPSLNGSRDGFAGRVNSEGRFVWVKNFGTVYNDEAQSICLDPSTGNVFAAAQVADAPVSFNGLNYPGYGNNDILVLGWNFYTQAPVWAKRVGSSTGDAPSIIRWDGQRLVVAGYAGGNLNTDAGGIGTLTSNGSQDAVLLRYDKTTGNVTSGQLIGGSGNDQALALWLNTSTRAGFLGGFFSNTVTFPNTSGPRTSNGAADGFITFISAPNNARMGEEVSTSNQAVFKAWPQPVRAGGQLTVTSDQAGAATLLDMQGKVLETYQLDAGETQLAMPHTQGLYVLRTAQGAHKIVVE